MRLKLWMGIFWWSLNQLQIYYSNGSAWLVGYYSLETEKVWANLKLRALRAPGEVTILSADGFGMTWRPGDILRTSQAKDVGLKERIRIFFQYNRFKVHIQEIEFGG